MHLNKIIAFAAVAGFVLAFAAPASAQGSFNFGYGQFGHHSGFSVGVSAPFYYPHHYYSYPAYSYPAYSYPAYSSSYPAYDRAWIAGHWENREQQVWVRGSTRREWVEPVYDTARDPAGNETRVMTQKGHWKVVEDPGHYETRNVQVWVPGHYE
jgi:hypothetical protein